MLCSPQVKTKKSYPAVLRHYASDRKLAEKVLEYIQGIAEVKSYNLAGEKSKALNHAIRYNKLRKLNRAKK